MEALSFLKRPMLQDPFEQSVLSKKVALPAKNIITKEYSPDIKPMVKLITKEQLRKSQKNISYIPPKIKNTQFQKYGQKFHVTDFLGYNYVQEFDQMVYFRYNNDQYNQLPKEGSQKGTKYFSGLFIPLQALQSKQFKVQDNIYEALNISAPQIKDSIAQSFSNNCKGCSLDPLFSSNFTSGNLMAAIRKNPFQYDLILQNDINCKAAEWFNFAVKFIEEGTYVFNIVNLSTDNSLYQMGMKVPFYSYFQQSFKNQSVQTVKSSNGWAFGGRNITYKKTDVRKQRHMLDQTYYCLSFQFKCKNRHEVVVFANTIPYTGLDYERFLNRVLYSKIGQHMKMQKLQICQTLAGNTLSAFVFYHRKSKSNTMILKSMSQQKSFENQRTNQRHKTLNLGQSFSSSGLNVSSNVQNSSNNHTKSVVFMARQHSGETPSSFVLQGIVQFLMDNTQFDVFKKNFQFIIIPFVNMDGVQYGNQRVNLAGADLNKVWKNPNQVFQPQAYHIKKFLKSVNQVHPISLMINLQSNSHSLSSYFISPGSKKQGQDPVQLFPYICSKRVPQISFQKSEFNGKQNLSLVSSLSQSFPKCLVYGFSISNYGWTTQNNACRRHTQSSCSEQEETVNEFTPDSYRTVGRELISTYLEYIRLCDKNIGIKDRWLKEIQALPEYGNIISRQIDLYEKRYFEAWDRDLLRFDYSLYLTQTYALHNQNSQSPKNKTALLHRVSGTALNEVRSKSKKLTMPNMNRSRNSTQEKQNSQIMDLKHKPGSQNLSIRSSNSDSSSILNQFKKSPLSSSIFTPKHRTQILKQISESIKQSSVEKQSSFIGQSSNLQTIIERKQKKLSRLLLDQTITGNQGRTKNAVSKKDSKTKLKGAIVKFQHMKKFISTIGIKADSATMINSANNKA